MVIRLSFLMVYILTQKKLKTFAFSQKSKTNLPFTNKSGIGGIFYCKVVYLK